MPLTNTLFFDLVESVDEVFVSYDRALQPSSVTVSSLQRIATACNCTPEYSYFAPLSCRKFKVKCMEHICVKEGWVFAFLHE